MLDVDVVDHAEQVHVDLVAPEHLKSLHHLLVGRLLSFGHAVVVVQLFGSVEAEADIKIFFGEELAPFLVDRRAVGLNAVDDLLVRRQMLFLQLNRPAEKIDAEQGRLAAVPGEAHDLFRSRLDVLDDVALQRFVAQPEIRAFRVELFFLEVVAVVAVQIADCSDRFYHDLEFTSRSFQRDHLRAQGLRHSTQKSRRCHHLSTLHDSRSSVDPTEPSRL